MPFKKNLSFPILPENQLIETYNSLSIDTTAILRKPTSQNTRDTYQQIILRLLNCSFEDVFGNNIVTTDDFTNPELHEHSVPYRAFSLIFPKIILYSGIEDFDEIKDIAKPSKRRVIMVLSGLLNLLKFTNALKDFSLQCESETFEISKSLEEAKNRRNLLENDKQKLIKTLENDEGEIKTLEEDITKNEMEIKSFQKELLKFDKIEEVRKKKYLTNKQNFKENKNVLHEKKKRLAKLEQQIVSSPEKIKFKLSDLKSKIDVTKKTVEMNDRKLKKCLEYERMADKLMNKINSRIAECNKIESDLKTIKSLKKKLKKIDFKINETKHKINTVEENKNALVGSQEFQKQRETDLQGEIEQKRKEMISALDSVHKKELSAQKTKAEEDQRVEQIRSKIAATEKRIAEARAREKELLNEADKEITLFKVAVAEFFKKTESSLGDFEARENVWASEIYEREQLSGE
ncbi:kinetochore-associated Ndc80 complex subunit nuf2 [Bonamia ostreae]|uniref:Kinetochore-associated Ndc80 complex subunit nuf2 n=1 Tax=Bonamia ostreae TaxID=126728 RepID=A0ABV2ALX2_9EUKA